MSKIHGLKQIQGLTIEDGSFLDATITNGKFHDISVGKTNSSIVVCDTDGSMVIGSDNTALSAYLQGVVPSVNGGFGAKNASGSLEFGGNITFTGADDVTFVTTAPTSVILPIDGVLATEQDVAGMLTNGLDVKGSCRVATLTPITLSAPGNTLDGVTPMIAGNRVLVAGQADAKTNGIYVWNGAAVAMTRSEDADNTPHNEISGGMFTFIEQGTSKDSGFVLLGDGQKTLGVDDLLFSRFSGSGQLTVVDDQLTLSSGGAMGLHIIGTGAGSHGVDATKVPSFTVDTFGRVTAASERILSLSSDLSITATAAELNILDGITADVNELNKLDGVTATAVELNHLTGIETSVSTDTSARYMAEEMSSLHSAGCLNADFVKLAAIDVSVQDLNDLANKDEYGMLVGAAAIVGTTGIAGITGGNAADIQTALNAIQTEIDNVNAGTAGMVDYEQVTVVNAQAGYVVAAGNFVAGSLNVWLNGLLMKKGAGLEEYTENAATGAFTFGATVAAALEAATDEIIVSYR